MKCPRCDAGKMRVGRTKRVGGDVKIRYLYCRACGLARKSREKMENSVTHLEREAKNGVFSGNSLD